MAYTTWLDVQDRLGRDLTEAERRQVDAWLGDIEASILARIPNLTDLVDAGTIPERTVVKVTAAAVLRVIRNPDGKLTERIDDYSWTRDTSTAGGNLYLTDDEWAELTPSAATDAFSIPLAYEPGWVDCAPRGAWWVQ